LRETHHIDDYPNNPLNRKVLKRKIVSIMREKKPDIRDVDIFIHADLIVEMFFCPTSMDIDCLRMRYCTAAIDRKCEYKRPIWIVSWSRFLQGKSLWVYPENNVQ
jgi:hypothetical protein